ncbi:MAG: hypothetical protein CBC35_00340 [Planctomycetes bacterium TMED75]|nr:hypothetical protein [Planctomycetaceae bacterium]OUU96899.1 MAG: hypothetical protein CBC35_00340 [Planctomycetes bacterium TMED75]
MTSHTSLPLKEYLKSAFQPPRIPVPLEDESHVSWWKGRFAQNGGTAQGLVESLTQFQVAIESGASGSSDYVRFIRQGKAVPDPKSAAEIFSAPDMVHWEIVDHPAGGLPVVTFEDRSDFELAFRALGARCEPVPIGQNVHALYVGGLPNPVRAGEMQAAFIASGNDPQAWSEEVQRRMELDGTSFHDRLILLHPAPYGGLPSSSISDAMDDHAWLQASMQLRIEHEFTHHTTHRLLGSYRLHVHDELIADLMGFTKAIGRFDAELFLRALGVQGGQLAPGARLLTYTVDLDESALPRLIEILHQAAKAVEAVASAFVGTAKSERFTRLLALSQIEIATLVRSSPDDIRKLIVGSTGDYRHLFSREINE